MYIQSLVKKIESKQVLTQKEIEWAIFSYANNSLTDEEFLPFVKAIYYMGLSDKELFFLTIAMLNSGEKLNLKQLNGVVDKHSTGGVSDTTTIVITPICACLGTKMLKLSGRGLGFTGGTADKLESFLGYRTDIEISEAINLVKQNGACMLTTTKSLAPADKKIYALRNKTGLVDSIPLIASSIMSKKLACDCDVIVLDVKYGNGAFMQDKKSAKLLGKKMKAIGKLAGKKIKIVLGKMYQPLGNNIGPKLETMEAIDILKNKNTKSDLYKECIRLASWCVCLDKKIPYIIAKHKAKQVLKNGLALNKLKQMVSSQGGQLDLFEESYKKATLIIKSPKNGKVAIYDTKKLGKIVAQMGTVQINSQDKICYENGIIIKKRIGNKVQIGDELFWVYYDKITEQLEKEILSCISIK